MRSRFVICAFTSAAACIATQLAQGDVTFTLTNQLFTGLNFNQYAAAGSLSGTLTGASINVTLLSSVSYTYADDLCVYLDSDAFSTGGALQIGGFSSLLASQRLIWPNGGSDAPGTTSIGSVTLVSPIAFGPASDLIVWIGNGYGAAGTSGTWSGTITLHGVSVGSPCPTLYRDIDGDGFGALSSGSIVSCTPVTGYVSNNTDCNDANPAINPTTVWFRDTDGDGFGASASGTATQCTAPSGFVLNNTDCNDANPAINPTTVWFRDTDGDGFGVAAEGTIQSCTLPTGYSLINGDNCTTIANANQADINANGVGDACELARGDLNLDGVVNASDVPLLFTAWGSLNPTPGDLNRDGAVNSADFSILLSNWGTTV